jgi:glycosyltransferase involved in cell wall biosynthesis
VVVLSERLRHLFQGLVPPERIRVAADGVVDPFPDGPPPPPGGDGAGGGVTTVGYLGLFYEPKGFLEVLEAAAILHRAEPGRFRFRFVGEWFSDAERATAEALLSEGGLRDAVDMLEGVTEEEKRAFLASLDILAFAGMQPEGLPLVVLEGMAAGRAVVATPQGSIPDAVVDGETGLLVPAGDRAALVAALRTLATDPAARRRMGAAGRRRYLEHYTDDRCIERMVSLFTTEAAG